MATETETPKVKTVDQVRALLAEGKNANEISEALGKTLATVYVHIRNIKGTKGKRGRPPKAKTAEGGNGVTGSSSGAASTTRKRPPISGQSAASSNNGHDKSVGDEFPLVKEAIQSELVKARSSVAKLEGMLSTIS